MGTSPLPATHFAPAERAEPGELGAARIALASNPLALALLEAMPYFGLVLNQQRQVIAANDKFIQALGVESGESLIGLRPGEIVQCIQAEIAPSGCGTAKACELCGAVNAILDCLKNKATVSRECRIRTRGVADGGALDLLVQASFLTLEARDFVFIALHDISSEKRRRVLERVFFHDVLNTAGGLLGLAELLLEEDDPKTEDEYKNDIFRLSERVIEEISGQRQLSAAENGELQIKPVEISLPDLAREVGELYRHHNVGQERNLQTGPLPEAPFKTDPALLRRVLGNLVKNALEAIPTGETVTISGEARGEEIMVSVHNPGVMPEEVRQQVFQRSFSTKGGFGRGIGTYSIKLFADHYLGGRVEFISREPEGTTFTVTLPRSGPPQAPPQEKSS
jgi:signal transduction histidine kinase